MPDVMYWIGRSVVQLVVVFSSVSCSLVAQSIVSLTSSLVVKMLTVLVNTISNSQFFFCSFAVFKPGRSCSKHG